MDKIDQRNKRGIQVVHELFGAEQGAAYERTVASGAFGAKIGKMALEFMFAEVWGDATLEKKHRSMVTLGVLIALGRPEEIKQHIRAGLNNGLTVAEIEAIILQAIPYAGFPSGKLAMQAALAVFEERGIAVG